MTLEARHAILDALMAVLDEERAMAVIEHRRVTIRKPLTVYAAKLLAKKLAGWGDANEAADIMIERAWQGFEPSWVKGRPQRAARRNFVDAALDRINNGSESVFVDRRALERISAEQQRPGPDIADIRGSVEGYPGSSRH